MRVVAVLGCLATLALAVTLLVLIVGWYLVPVVGVVAAIAAGATLLERWQKHRLLRAFRAKHGADGPDMLLVYTDSPHWAPYIESTWLPRWGSRAVALNRSKPWDRHAIEVRIWRAVAGDREHTPLAIIVPPQPPLQVIRLFAAFRDFKHGREHALRRAEAEIESALARIARRAA